MSSKYTSMDTREKIILEFIKKAGACSSKEIHEKLDKPVSYATLKRVLARLIEENLVTSTGNGRATKYTLSQAYQVLSPIDVDDYFSNEIDERNIRNEFSFSLIDGILAKINLFTANEISFLNDLQEIFQNNILSLSKSEYQKEMERLAIDLSWKSSQIEGNTYSLLETERLLKERETAAGKTREEATMLLNHKEALDLLVENADNLSPLSIAGIEDIHGMLIKDLGVERNLRKSRVGISGTNYRPLDNPFQIAEALGKSCDLINSRINVFEKALLALVLISYIQPFADGNKRTARIVSNSLLLNERTCPLSFRTVDSIEYKKAMLLFYEQNNISRIKEIFIEQCEFAVKTYF